MFLRSPRLRTALLGVALALPLAGCESPSGPSNADHLALQRAKAAWAAYGVDDYTMVVGTMCFCGVQEIRFTVVNGVVTERVTTSALPAPNNFHGNVETVEAMLTYIEQAIHDRAAKLDVTYDEHGVPMNVFIDYDESMYDEEFGWSVKSLTITPS